MVRAHNGIEALGAVFAVDGLGWSRSAQLCSTVRLKLELKARKLTWGIDVLASHGIHSLEGGCSWSVWGCA